MQTVRGQGRLYGSPASLKKRLVGVEGLKLNLTAHVQTVGDMSPLRT